MILHSLSRHIRKGFSSGALLRKMGLFVALPLLVLVAGVAGMSLYHDYFSFLPEGVRYLGEDFSGLNRAEAQERLKDLFRKKENERIDLLVRKGGETETLQLSYQELGLLGNPEEITERFFGGRNNSDLSLHGSAPMASPAVVDSFVKQLLPFEVSPHDAQLSLDDYSEQWKIQEQRMGYALSENDKRDFFASFQEKLVEEGEMKSVPELSLHEVKPLLYQDDLETLFEKLQVFLDKSVRWELDGYSVVLRLRDYPWLVDVDEEKEMIFVSEEAVDAYVTDWAKLFDQVHSEIFVGLPVEMDAGYLKAPFDGPFEKGRTLDKTLFKQRILEALRGEETDVNIEVPFQETPPVVRSWDGEQLQLLSQGRSSYREGNGVDRVYNIRFGLQKYDGVVIPQGAEFSFNQILGWVTYEDGWKPALAIFGGGGVRPVPGGGLCQVSTTMYRAAVLGGLPVTKRKPHSLDISYYHEYGYGIDATVYPPEDIDLKFINDTPGPIVLHAYVDTVLEEAYVEFYGFDDGRSVVLEQVQNRRVILPQEIVETSSLPSGKTEVRAHGRMGKYIEWAWKVIRADGSVDERVIETLYPAAPKTVLVGVGG